MAPLNFLSPLPPSRTAKSTGSSSSSSSSSSRASSSSSASSRSYISLTAATPLLIDHPRSANMRTPHRIAALGSLRVALVNPSQHRNVHHPYYSLTRPRFEPEYDEEAILEDDEGTEGDSEVETDQTVTRMRYQLQLVRSRSLSRSLPNRDCRSLAEEVWEEETRENVRVGEEKEFEWRFLTEIIGIGVGLGLVGLVGLVVLWLMLIWLGVWIGSSDEEIDDTG